ncbi:MAG: carboxypeptidase-like regulatory domain-containing protein [Candidatus Acidiferrales bacterium]
MTKIRSFYAILACLALLIAIPAVIRAQNTVSGGVSGSVTDTTGAAVPNARVTIENVATGETQQPAHTNSLGSFLFPLLKPGSYLVRVSTPNFHSMIGKVEVQVGSTSNIRFQLEVGAASETVEVSETAITLDVRDTSSASDLTQSQVQQTPNPGNDITYAAQMATGTVMNTEGGYGNFSANGISATSNLFTLDGMDDNDPYLNLNNSGATNLSLGLNEVQEVTVTTSSYGGAFGGAAGSNVNYVTRSGSNQFHGKANYFWNGSALDANTWFDDNSGTPKSFINANQYGADIGGPIVKNKLFFYFDTEGLFLIIPSSEQVLVPTKAFETDTIANLESQGLSDSVPYYNTMFNLYNNAPGASRATFPPPGESNFESCGNWAATDGTGLGSTVACSGSFYTNVSSPTHEKIYALRIDYNLGSKDTLFARWQEDHGLQATYTDPIDSAFNAVSNQPEFQGQLNETHTFGPSAVNQFLVSSSWYEAPFNFANPSAALSAFPTSMYYANGLFSQIDADAYAWPEGRNVTQAQISDDYSKSIGRQTFRFGAKWRTNYSSDSGFGVYTHGLEEALDTDAFYNGGVDAADPVEETSAGEIDNLSIMIQAFPQSPEQRFKFWGMGGYAEDDIQLKPDFTLTLSLRVDHESNPTCKDDCFARLNEDFEELVTNPDLSSGDTPYNSVLTGNYRDALSGLQGLEWQPRVGFAWEPLGDRSHTIIRGGIGIFNDPFPGQITEEIASNPPLLQEFEVFGDYLSPAQSTAGTCGSGGSGGSSCVPATTNLFADEAASNAGFLTGFSAGESANEIADAVPAFAPPNLTYTQARTKIPQYQKWNLEVEHRFGPNTSLAVEYDGNHGIHEPISDNGLNGYADGFAGLPEAPPDPEFLEVTGVFTEGVSNYNGLSATFTHRYSSGEVQIAYTWSHAMDDISNGGFLPFSYATNESPYYPQNPFDIKANYGDSDYDVRHYLKANYVWELPFAKLTGGRAKSVVGGWQVSGTFFVHSGLPFTPVDLTESGALSYNGYGGTIFATLLGSHGSAACSGPGNNVDSPCINTADYTGSTSGFGNAGRNSLRGPNFFDADFSLTKYIPLPRWEGARIGLAANAYNVFNHPNFDTPDANVDDSEFGQILNTVSSPTSTFGSFLGANASARILQLKASLEF